MNLTDYLEALFLRLLAERCGDARLSGVGRAKIDETTRRLRKSVLEALARVDAQTVELITGTYLSGEPKSLPPQEVMP